MDEFEARQAKATALIQVTLTLKLRQKRGDSWYFYFKGEEKEIKDRQVRFMATDLMEAVRAFHVDEVTNFDIRSLYEPIINTLGLEVEE